MSYAEIGALEMLGVSTPEQTSQIASDLAKSLSWTDTQKQAFIKDAGSPETADSAVVAANGTMMDIADALDSTQSWYGANATPANLIKQGQAAASLVQTSNAYFDKPQPSLFTPGLKALQAVASSEKGPWSTLAGQLADQISKVSAGQATSDSVNSGIASAVTSAQTQADSSSFSSIFKMPSFSLDKPLKAVEIAIGVLGVGIVGYIGFEVFSAILKRKHK